MVKCGYYGTYHKLRPKHLNPYVAECTGHQKVLNVDTIDKMGDVVAGLECKRVNYTTLIADKRNLRLGIEVENRQPRQGSRLDTVPNF